MLSDERWKPQPARWSAVHLIAGAGLGVSVFGWGWIPAVVGLGLLLFAVILLLATIHAELQILTRLARVIFHQDGGNVEAPDTAFIARLRGERWNSAGRYWERADISGQPPPPSWWSWETWKATAETAEILERQRVLGVDPLKPLRDLRDVLWGAPPGGAS